MGIFSAFIGNGETVRVELARELALSRIGYMPSTHVTPDQFATLYEMIKKMGSVEVLSLPEGSIVTIVHYYSELIHKRIDHSSALKRIEAHRKQIGSRNIDIAEMSLDEYVAYRLSVEMPNGPMPGMDDYWFNRCMSSSSEEFKIPWRGGPTEPASITRSKK